MSAGNVVALRPVEFIHQDAEPVALLFRNLGTDSAEQVVARALGELAIEISFMSGQVEAHELGDLGRQLRRLQRMGENLGLISLSTVAGDARTCLASGDSTAFAAVWARLIRVAEHSFETEIGFLDQTLV